MHMNMLKKNEENQLQQNLGDMLNTIEKNTRCRFKRVPKIMHEKLKITKKKLEKWRENLIELMINFIWIVITDGAISI